MTDRNDGVEDWLTERVEPLSPPPGTFDLIKQRARRRKYRKLAITASTAAVLVAAAVAVPQVVNLQLSPTPKSVAQAGRSVSATPSQVSSAAVSATATPSATATTPAGTGPVPASFKPSSVTFVGTQTGFVIGQAGTPGHCATQYCTSAARTSDAGQSWAGVGAPVAGPPDGATGVGEIRFLNTAVGWAFGPGLYVTHNGGQKWAQVDTQGLRVTDLETVGSRAYAVFASCTGSGTAFAADCTRFSLYSSPAGSSAWTPVGPATTGLTSGAASEATSLVLTGSRGYLLGPDGSLYAGPVDGSAAWTKVSSVLSSCHVGGPQSDGQPTGVLLGAVDAKSLVMACNSTSGGGQAKTVYSSPNDGVSWLPMATAPATGTAYSLAASPSESLVLGTSTGIAVLPAGDITWRPATLDGTAPAGGFGYVGMTTDKQGIALPADPSSGTVWFTFDGGKTWKPSKLNGS